MDYYIADTHFGHANIVIYDHANGGRNFKSIDEHDEFIISQWNSVVKDNDTVYILGDFSWKSPGETEAILKRLKGRKMLIKGNHDKWADRVRCENFGVCDYKKIKDNGDTIILSHFPILMWDGQHRDSILFYGHVHNTIEYDMFEKSLINVEFNMKKVGSISSPLRAFNVGCMIDYMDYRPRTKEEILKNMIKQQ